MDLFFNTAFDLYQLITHNSFARVVFALLTGAMIGSFINVVVYRLPQMLKNYAVIDMHLMHPTELTESRARALLADVGLGGRSITPCCDNRIKARHNIPIISYLFLRGRCAYCSTLISSRYLINELVMALLCVLLVMLGLNNLALFFMTSITALLLIVANIDIRYRLLPPHLTMPIGFTAILMVHYDLVLITMSQGIISAIALYIFLTVAKTKGQILLGQGDVELIVAVTIAIGAQMSLSVLALATLSSWLVAKIRRVEGKKERAFGQYISVFTFGA
ncbi:Type 4 prepilin-like proteins leader peptide-processing enzyme [Vibrio thalassae]|uniref:Type 4 prepilin-like proteins leader peptide-processing enzyme n=3 Tax=Vibrio thalassae TaxID=1243014 RepID=A0A240EL23_9VIBR|nr:Type 4 prepilin-like proteins leader peptide-processing enzyme [Vibrio thalassae]